MKFTLTFVGWLVAGWLVGFFGTIWVQHLMGN